MRSHTNHVYDLGLIAGAAIGITSYAAARGEWLGASFALVILVPIYLWGRSR